jgi:hypothetical protein
MTATTTTSDNVYLRVEDAYGYRSENAINEALSKKIAVSLGYNPADMAQIPVDANIGEGCGNPLLIANLKEVGAIAPA